MTRLPTCFLVLSSALLLAACGDKAAPTPEPAGAGSLLADEAPAGAVSVLEALEMEEGEEVVVAGRVRMMANGVFVLVDDSVDFCRRGTASDNCTTPWDYCCHPEEANAGSMVVEVKHGGKPVAVEDLGLRRLDLVTVKGVLARDDKGTLHVVGTPPWHRGDRPDLGDDIDWNQ